MADFQVCKNSNITLISLFFDVISFSGVLHHIYKKCTEITTCHVWAFLVITYGGMIIQRISVILKTRYYMPQIMPLCVRVHTHVCGEGGGGKGGRLAKTDITHTLLTLKSQVIKLKIITPNFSLSI
jgi:hypothetical protein